MDRTEQSRPVQEISRGPFERNATGEFVAAARKEFKDCLRKVCFELAIATYDRKSTDIKRLTEQALQCRERYFQAMKGATNITNEDIENLIVKEFERQSRFYARLAKIEAHFRQLTGPWTSFAMHLPSTFDDRSGWGISRWDIGLTVGCDLTVGSTGLLAFPLVQATTAEYYDDILFIDEDCIIVLNYLPKAAEPFQHASTWCTEFAESGAASIRRAKGDFPLAKEAIIYDKFLLLDSEESLTHKQVQDIRNKYGVVAIVKTDPENHTAFIFKEDDDYPLHVKLELSSENPLKK